MRLSRVYAGERSFVARLSREGLPGVVDLIAEYVSSLASVKNPSIWQRYLLCLRARGLERVGFIALKTALESASGEDVSMCSCACRIGRFVEDQALADDFMLRDPGVASSSLKFAKRYKYYSDYLASHITKRVAAGVGSPWDEWGKRARISCGVTLLGFVKEATGAIESFNKRSATRRRRPTLCIRLTKSTQEWKKGYQDYRAKLIPLFLPMVEEPVPWSGAYGGGYPSGSMPAVPFIRTHKRRWLTQADISSDVFDAVNKIQATPFTINKKVLAVAEWATESGAAVGGLQLGETLPLPEWPGDDITPEQKREFCVTRRVIHRKNNEILFSHRRVARLCALAAKFREDARIYFPHSCDFRGRVYPVSTPILSPQGSDMARGLLSFARKRQIKGGERWLLIHAANCWGDGLDKASFDDRIAWVEENTKNLRAVARDPLSERMWTEAGDPWQFLSACFELDGMHSAGSSFETSLPCGLDATNSGIQILSLLSRDPVCAAASNVTPSPAPRDIYQDVCDLVVERLKVDASRRVPFAYHWLHYKELGRKTTKGSVMTFAYGLTPYTNRQLILDWLDEQPASGSPFLNEERVKASSYLAGLVWDSMLELVVAPARLMEWMQDAAAAQTQGMHWRTPLGFPVFMERLRQESRQVKTHFMGAVSHVRFNEDTGALDSRAMSGAVVPNFVHSLDACALMMAVLRYPSDDLMVVHDCFSTHASGCSDMRDAVRESYCELFSENLLDLFNESLTIPANRERPQMGELDLNSLMQSEYFIS